MPQKLLLCRTATTFAPNGNLDENAFRLFMQRFVRSKVGVYLGSGGSGEGHALTHAELKRVYQLGVEECKGKVPVYANPPEAHSPQAVIEQTMLAVEAGVELINIYGPAPWHGFLPTDAELIAYYDAVLPSIRYPVALAPQPLLGYAPKPAVLADVCRRYPQVEAVNLSGVSDAYFVDFKDRLNRDLPLYVSLEGSLNTLALGAHGLNGAEANIVPKTYRRYMDLYESGQTEELGRVYRDLKRIFRFVEAWAPATPRWLKMFFKVFKLPGDGLRLPYLMPSEAELQKFADGLMALNVPEITELGRAAGLSVPG